ncbi:MAG: hypothetical protein A2806_02465 [Candidatus Terrybacteria bacterium RIFCSPHIGHO2_01_FULL_48_17]|uniref:Type II secretion system protein GspG C-terminal domain-containing protein n=1 Tax=Candidatus Terrybacteria bacterium RIFCSPHIGHO2_01_FULL_48_17 TaxID=1802362 RepID=A0A1G2PJQ6_9BACT|nr:MAG: hypothetical protein A2806_02465 [Candidatus Terrybacteria bacterium RIFCSPHIGHO2_01_FULL_48_17]OHA53604.1 MAG: hypothetical protein A3A30_00420 [Candidatus Terrybacteria bacterium RIFCSPLOWO2_01_FULL_48_14]
MQTKKGFTLIELLLVVVIIGILAAAIFVALDPGRRLGETRDGARASDVTAILDAVKLHQFDNGGAYHANIAGQAAGTPYMVVDGAPAGGCPALACAEQALGAGNCVNYSFVVTDGYLGEVPVAPQTPGGPAYTAAEAGYYSIRNANGTLEIGACDVEEGASTIRAVR